MPLGSNQEWRARIGSSWCALGRPLKSKSSRRIGRPNRRHSGKRLSSQCGQDCTVFMMTMLIPWMTLTTGLCDSFSGAELFLSFVEYVRLDGFLYQLLVSIFQRTIRNGFKTVFCFTSCAVNTTTRLIFSSLFQCVQVCMKNGKIIMNKLKLSWLKISLSMLVIVLAAATVRSLLLRSGNVESNPGPDLDYNDIDSSQILDKDNLPDVTEEVLSIQSLHYHLGRALRLRNTDLKAICKKYPSESEAKKALEEVLLLWLDQQYNVQRFGGPTWKMLVEAVDMKAGGNNHELAKTIALKYPADNSKSTVDTAPGVIKPQNKDDIIQNDENSRSQVTPEEKPDDSIRERSRSATIVEKEEPDPDQLLTIANIREVLDKCWNYRAKWKLIGIELGIDMGTLDSIETNHRDVEDCLIDLICHWLRGQTPKPTRREMTTALQSRYIAGKATSAQGNDVQIKDYASYLKSLYKFKTLTCSSEEQWPPPVKDKIFRLAMINTEEKLRMGRQYSTDEFVRQKTIAGKVDDILQQKVPIELDEVFTKIDSEQKKVLMEGAPGCGKSTLSLYICHQWTDGKLFQEYKLVILVRLRDSAIHEAKSIAELLPRRNERMGQGIEEAITANDGSGVLFVLDGWDELPQNVPCFSFVKALLEGNQLHRSSIIITSRPSSSAYLHKVVLLRIEILGFTKDELRKYFTTCFQDEIKAVENLLSRIRQNPVVEGSCYLPLNASILVHLFKCGGNELPTTQYGIFTELVYNCIHRHLMRTRQADVELKSLNKLPPQVDDPFQQLCRIAYNGVMEDKVVFDLGSNFNTLGLLQGVESFAFHQMSHSYNFLHLSIQELLAAIYMATKLDEEEQAKQFKKLFGQARFNAVFQFFAAETKLQTSGIRDVVIQVANKCAIENAESGDRALLVSLMHCLFEAQDDRLCQLVAGELKQKFNLGGRFGGIGLNPADCYSIGHFLIRAGSCREFEVVLQGCSIGVDHCKALFQHGEVYNFRILDLDNNSIGDEGAVALSAVMKTMTKLQKLYLGDNSISNKGAVALSEALKKLTNLQWIGLGDNSIGDEGAVAISKAVKEMPNLQTIDLWSNSFGDIGKEALSAAAKLMNTEIDY